MVLVLFLYYEAGDKRYERLSSRWSEESKEISKAVERTVLLFSLLLMC